MGADIRAIFNVGNSYLEIREGNVTIISMNSEAYQKAKRLGEKACREAAAKGASIYLPSLDALPITSSSTEHIGIMEIPLSLIIGTKTVNRQNAFAVNYMPLLKADSEFAHKWVHVYDYQEEHGISEPIVVYEYLHHFYVQEGNKRVSILKYMHAPSVEADVIRIIPADLVGETGKRYQEFLQFFRVCPVYEIVFSHLGDYHTFANALKQSFTEKWSIETVHLAEAVYYRFYMIFSQLGGACFLHITAGDALLLYLRIYTPSSIMDDMRTVLEERVKKLWRYFAQLDEGVSSAIKIEPMRESKIEQTSFLRSIYPSVHPLSVAFLYDGKNDRFQEEGRLAMSRIFGEKIISRSFGDCSTEEKTKDAIQEAIESGTQVIFTTSKAMYKSAVQAAIAYPRVWIYNASLTQVPAFLQTYACRLYEGIFLMGALAAMKSDVLGYAGDCSKCGKKANINAFALGAQSVNPHAHVYLSEKETVHLCMMENGLQLIDTEQDLHEAAKLSMDWGRYDCLLIEMILSNQQRAKNKAIQYWYGMSAGVVKLHVKEQMPEFIAKLYQDALLGDLKPFGEMNTAEIITMQDFVSNVGVK